jgi:hypothetical protein
MRQDLQEIVRKEVQAWYYFFLLVDSRDSPKSPAPCTLPFRFAAGFFANRRTCRFDFL